jgi:type II secretory ATPase GspE/PulE/Tfp pilus assembly ATPase PilB-like protein
VLLDELAIKPALVGRALADFFGVPYFMFQVDRRRPQGLLDSFNREYVVQHQWMPIEEGRHGLFILAVDPDRLKASGAVQRVFPHATPIYCVTTRREFGWMVNQFFGAAAPDSADAATEAAARAPAYAAMSDDTFIAPPARRPVPALPGVEQTLIANAVSPLLLAAAQHGISELHITTAPGANGEIRFQVNGVLRKT